MRKGLVISILSILLTFIFAGCSSQKDQQINTNNQINQTAREDQIHKKIINLRNGKRNAPPIARVNMIERNNQLKMKLNSDSSVVLIDHNDKAKSHYHDQELVVGFKSQPTKAAVEKMARDINGTVQDSHDTMYIFKSKSLSPDEMSQYFQRNKNVDYAEPHYIFLPNEVNDTYYQSYQWNLPAIGTEDGWAVTRGSKKIKIAVVDTGVDLDHPDLKGRLQKGYNIVANNDNPDDDNGHGTHVAGIIASDTNNKKGVAGITWYNPIIPVKVMDSKGQGGSFNIAKGVRWAADHGADVINLSLGNYQSCEVMNDAVEYALKKNVVVVASAGNDNTNQPTYPAAIPGVISVAAVDWDGKRADFSNYGDYIDVAAPGVEIPSTYFKSQYASLSGTSMAAPHVSALAGLIRSVNPKLKNTEVADIINQTTQKNGNSGPDPYYGNGIIDNVAALQMASKNQSIQTKKTKTDLKDDLFNE